MHTLEFSLVDFGDAGLATIAIVEARIVAAL